jgi:Mg2+/Co2+ transporter CorB
MDRIRFYGNAGAIIVIGYLTLATIVFSVVTKLVLIIHTPTVISSLVWL